METLEFMNEKGAGGLSGICSVQTEKSIPLLSILGGVPKKLIYFIHKKN